VGVCKCLGFTWIPARVPIQSFTFFSTDSELNLVNKKRQENLVAIMS
jgi:hypothetical protein